MEEALRAKLLTTAPLAAMVGTRVDWGVRSQGAILPAVVLHHVGGVLQMNLAGPSAWSRDRFQIDCWGRTYKAARDVSNVIAGPGGVLIGFRSDLGSIRLRTLIINRRSDEDSDGAGPVFRSIIDGVVWHTPIITE